MAGGKGRLMGGTMISGGAVTPSTGPTTRILPASQMAEAARRRMDAADAQRRHSELKREAENRERAWVADQLRRDIDAAGAPVGIQSVEAMYAGYSVRLLQWLPHGVAASVRHEVRINRPSVATDQVEGELRRAISARFARFLATQRELADRFGAPRIAAPDEIDLSNLTIERPVRAVLQAAFGEGAATELRLAVSANTDVFRSNKPAHHRALTAAGIENATATVTRGRVTGAFTVEAEGVRITWSKGSVAVLNDASYPDALIQSLVGRRLGEIVDHPLVDGEMVVTAATPMRRGGRNGVSLVVKQFDEPVPSDW